METGTLENVKWWWFIIWFLLFFFILPIVSAMFEINKVTREHEIVDGFNLLYVYFRFPIYWMLGIFEITILAFLERRQMGAHFQSQ